MPGAPSTPRALEAGVCPGWSRRACRPSETHSCCRPKSSTTRLPTPNTSWRDSTTSPTPCAGTRSPGFAPSCASESEAHTNGSSASQRARARNEPFVRLGLGASTSSRSLGREGGRLIRIWRFRRSMGSLRVRVGGAPLLCGLAVARLDLLLYLCLGAFRVGRLLSFRGGTGAGRSGGAGQSAAAEGARQDQEEKGTCSFHFANVRTPPADARAGAVVALCSVCAGKHPPARSRRRRACAAAISSVAMVS